MEPTLVCPIQEFNKMLTRGVVQWNIASIIIDHGLLNIVAPYFRSSLGKSHFLKRVKSANPGMLINAQIKKYRSHPNAFAK